MATDALTAYRDKRDFTATTEPGGKVKAGPRGAGGIFVIQRHAARALHYDFRLELDGVLKSWAVPKGPSRDPAVKRLAVAVEDHPLDYAGFSGDIPKGHYGAGHVDIWDNGTWTPQDPDPAAALAKGRLHFALQGGVLQGDWILIRTGHDGKSWLLRKREDAHVVAGDDAEAIAPTGGSAVPQRERSTPGATHGNGAGKAARRRPAMRTANRRAAPASAAGAAETPGTATPADMPERLTPQLATLVDAPPTDEGWRYELKYDGYRMLCRVDATGVRWISRTGKDWTDRMQPLAQAIDALHLGTGWIDGEVVVFGEDGKTDFQALQNALDARATTLHFIAFDLPWWDGQDLRALPLDDRQARLQALLRDTGKAPISFTDQVQADDAHSARDALAQACRLGLEGLIAKRGDAPYSETRSRSWLKLKCRPRQEFVVGGFTSPAGSRAGFGALLVGVREGGALQYAGRIGTGFDSGMLDSLHAQLRKLAVKASPFAADLPPSQRRFGSGGPREITWVKPTLVIEAEFAGWTGDGVLRQASFVGLREDKPARDVGREVALDSAAASSTAPGAASARSRTATTAGAHATGRKASGTKAANAPDADAPARARVASQAKGKTQDKARANPVAGIRITHPDRLLFRDPDIDKLTLAAYYDAVGDRLMPHLADRRLAMMRCPQGTQSECFFQKHIAQRLPEGIKRDGEHILVAEPRGVVALAQNGVIELHTWGSTLPRADRADRITLDLDPGPGIEWATLVEAAQLCATLLRELDLVPFVKTTGGKGLHVVTPIRRTLDWDQAKRFAGGLATHLSGLMPDRFTANMSKARRNGRIFIDYLRNGENATAIAAFAVRARQGAPVSVPIAWEDLDASRDLREAVFNVRNVPAMLARWTDPWADYPTSAGTVTRDLLTAFDKG